MKDSRPRLLVFASGTSIGGGSGFANLVKASRDGMLQAKIVAVVSNHANGGVAQRAKELGIQFLHSPKGRTKEDYQRIVTAKCADFVALSGWLGKVEGLDPKTTINIHPAWLPSPYGGQGMYGHHVHEAVLADFKGNRVKHHGLTMHFVTEKYDDSDAIFFRRKVDIYEADNAETLAARVNAAEHVWQPHMTNLVVTGQIHWDGKNGSSIIGADIQP